MLNKSLLHSSRFVSAKVRNEILFVAEIILVENRSKFEATPSIFTNIFDTGVPSFFKTFFKSSKLYLEQFSSMFSI